MPVLHVEQLSIDRGDRRVLSGLSLRVEPGEIVHIVGRNGAGKTSLLETLCGLRTPQQGELRGVPTAQERHWIGHRNGLNAALSPLENLRFWGGLNSVPLDDPTAGAALGQLGLHAQRHRPVGMLSTGQKRRAALARLAAVRRGWWFLDEPLAGLDSAGLEIFAALMDRHASAGGTAIVSSHQPLPGSASRVRTLALPA